MEYSFDAIVVGNVAVFREQKQLPLWLDIAEKTIQKHSNVYFLLVGSGPLWEEVQTTVQKKELHQKIILPGLQQDVKSHLSAMDIFMLSSKFEGLPLALLEAMACEVAVLASPVGGVPEVIEVGKSGLMPEKVTLETMLYELDKLITDHAFRRKLAISGRIRVEEHFSIKRMVGELEGIYLKFLS